MPIKHYMLIKLDRIAQQLASIASVDEAKELRDKAEAIRVYSRQQRDCKQIEREATIIRIRAERQLGKLLATKVRAGNPNCTPGGQLPEGITRNQSSQWQLIAKVPQKQFEKYLEVPTPSSKGIMRLATAYARKRRNAKGADSGGNILTGDMWQLHSHLEDESVDLFLTDPPYAELDCYSRLAELAASKLKDGGLCLAYSGQHHLPEVMQRMGEHLDYWWMISIVLAGHPVRTHHNRRLQNAWKPVLMYAKGKPKHDYFRDIIKAGKREKELHDWQQPQIESEYLIEHLSNPGDMVVDPFCGSGTTLAAAKKLSRNYLGCELDQNTARGARRRIAA